ncbi:glycoside hydrolase family 32 protein [Acetobacteraceae bacterium]|nr:glycoside hydrolase family 32 protein [Acetobacteraceae bacterium]
MKIGESLYFLENLRTGLAVSSYYPFYHATSLPSSCNPLWMNEPQNILFDEKKNILRSWQVARLCDPSERECISGWVQNISFNNGISWIPCGKTIFPYREDIIGFFGGTVLRDWHNSAGFGHGAVLYFVTAETSQGQKVLRYWAESFGNEPIFDSVVFEQPQTQKKVGEALRDFRIHWDGQQWVAVISLSYGMAFYASLDTKKWERVSLWVAPNHVVEVNGALESPSFTPIFVEGEAKPKYILCYADHLVASGRVLAVVGDWDGKIFRELSAPQCLDFGCDIFAPNCSVDPVSGQVFLQGWMGNWSYVQYMPFKGFFNAETLLREVRLQKETYEIQTYPLKNQDDVFPVEIDFPTQIITPEEIFDFAQVKPGRAYKLEMDLKRSESEWPEKITFSFEENSQKREQAMVFEIFPHENLCQISRKKASMSFSKEISEEVIGLWKTKQSLPLKEEKGVFKLAFFVDSFSVEVFCLVGGKVSTNIFFPKQNKSKMSLSCDTHAVEVSLALRRA